MKNITLTGWFVVGSDENYKDGWRLSIGPYFTESEAQQRAQTGEIPVKATISFVAPIPLEAIPIREKKA